MSKYIPRTAVERETMQQIRRRAHGLKTGDYVRFPDSEKGPFVLKKSRVESTDPETIEAIAYVRQIGEQQLAALQSAADTAAATKKEEQPT